MRKGRGRLAAAMAIMLCACGDDGVSGDAETTSDATTASETSQTTASDASTTATSVDSSSGESDGSTTSADSGSSSTGSVMQTVVLQNDGWMDGDPVLFQGGFVMDECWASVFVPEPEHYPLEVDVITMTVGGQNMGAADFAVSVMTVDGQNQPDTVLVSGVANVSGDDQPDNVIVELLQGERPVIESGSFAVSVCFTAHDGFPAIARDDDGTITDDRNWIYTGGAWVQSSTLGLTGDWIMRASVLVP